jgi:hypothetical protein
MKGNKEGLAQAEALATRRMAANKIEPAAGAAPITTRTQPVNSTPTTAATAHPIDTIRTGPAASRPLLPAPERSDKAIVKVPPKVGSALPTFSAPPIDAVVLSNLADKDLISVAKHTCSIYKQAGAYAKDFLAELKRRFDEGKKLGKPYLGYKNFDKLCDDRLEIGARQARNILNNNPSGKKGRTLKPRPTLQELENVKAENKRLKAHAKLIEDANDRIAGGHERLAVGYTKQDLEQAKKDAVRDHQKIAAKEKEQSENEVEALRHTVRKLTQENGKLQKEPKQSRSKPASTKSSSRSLIADSETPTREEVVRHAVAFIKPFSLSDRRLIIDEIEARLRDESTRDVPDASKTPSGYTSTAAISFCLP